MRAPRTLAALVTLGLLLLLSDQRVYDPRAEAVARGIPELSTSPSLSSVLSPPPPPPTPLPPSWSCAHNVSDDVPACAGFPGLPHSCTPNEVLRRWHVTTQELLFIHLRQLWADDRPRVMVDLGSHAGHGAGRNVSDALLWLDAFHAPGSVVLGVVCRADPKPANTALYGTPLRMSLSFTLRALRELASGRL